MKNRNNQINTRKRSKIFIRIRKIENREKRVRCVSVEKRELGASQ